VPKSGDSFVAAPGALIKGSKLLTSWASSGSTWKATGQTQQLALVGSCSPSGYAGCKYAEAVYYDGLPLWRVMTLAEVGPGKFFFDYAADTIAIGDNPSGHTVEAAVAPSAFEGTSSIANVTIRGFVIEQFANAAQHGAIHANKGGGWVVADNEVRYNHGAGISTNSNSVARGNYVHHNGQMGMHSSGGTTMLVEDNEIAFNNIAGFSYGWEAGGAKWVKTDGLVVRGNYSHDNKGPGLWTDIDNIRTTIEGNRVEDNHDNGIFHEISYDAVIRNNVVRRNGFKRAYEWLNGAGIFISASGGSGDGEIEVYGNIVADNLNGIALQQQDRGDGDYGPHLVRNVRVHDNEIRMKVGASGAVEDVGGDAMFGADIVFARNDYRVGDARAWRWDGRDLDWKAWQAYGLDEGGSARRI
jgi:parallel beta-helix repeat protein